MERGNREHAGQAEPENRGDPDSRWVPMEPAHFPGSRWPWLSRCYERGTMRQLAADGATLEAANERLRQAQAEGFR